MKDIHAQHEDWAKEVRDPAERNTEGARTIEVKNAKAEYEIAKISETRWAVTWNLRYECGNYCGCSIPWIARETREDCITAFVNAARNFFDRPENYFEAQMKARKEMLAQLVGGLFGFQEPEPIVE